jgi:WD40 repeat protein
MPDAAPGRPNPARELRQLWQAGQRPDVRDFLAGAGHLAPCQVAAVLLADQRERWRIGERIPAETYLHLFPHLADDFEYGLELVYGEFLLAEHRGEAPDFGAYARRFPRYEARLRLQVELHQAFASHGEPTPAPAGAGGRSTLPGTAAAGAPPALAGYEVLDEIGRGGMGVVYRARQAGLGRLVAIKMIRAPGAVPAQVDRFRAEAEAVARLQHPNVIQIHEVGEHEGCPYFALEYAGGGSLASRLAGTPQPPRAATGLIRTLAEAIAAAHRAGVVHRDLKPSNVLLTEEGVPKVADFGLAKTLGADHSLTRTGDVMGTPSYMAPEQAGGGGEDVGLAADIYGLGAILYEMLTGRPPFKGTTALDTLDQVRTREPVPPRQLQPATPRDLETICLKCLHKEPHRRYASAAALAADCAAFLAGEPIAARPTPLWERAARWARRHPGSAALGAAVVLVSAVGLLSVLVLWRRAEDHAQAATEALTEVDRQRRSVQRQLARAAIDQAASLGQQEDAGAALWLAHGLENAVAASDADLEVALRSHLAAWLPEVHTLEHWQHMPAPVQAVALSPDGRTYLAGCDDGTAQLWDRATGEPRGSPLRHPGPVLAADFSADGRRVVTVCADGARVWETASGRRLGPVLGGPAHPGAVAMRPDGLAVVIGSRPKGWVGLWEVETGKQVGSLLSLAEQAHRKPGSHAVVPFYWQVLGLALGADGRTVLTALPDLVGTGKWLQLWEAGTWRPLAPTRMLAQPVLAGAFQADGRVVALTLEQPSVKGPFGFRDLDTGERSGPPLAPPSPLVAMAFSPGARYAIAANDQMGAQVYEVTTGRPCGAILPQPGGVRALACGRDGRTAVVGCQDGSVRLWQVHSDPPACRTFSHRGAAYILDVRFSRDGGILLSRSYEAVRLWDSSTGRPIGGPLPHDDRIVTGVFDPGGRLVATGGNDRMVRLWDAPTGRPVGVIGPHPIGVEVVAFLPDGQGLLAVDGSAIHQWDLSDLLRAGTGGKARPVGEFAKVVPTRWREIACSPAGRTLVVWGQDSFADLWDADTGERIGARLQHQAMMGSAAFRPDGLILATCAGDQTRLWDPATGQSLGPPLPHRGKVLAVAFHPGGRLLATASQDQTAQLWEVASLPQAQSASKGFVPAARPLGPPLQHQGPVTGVAFSPDGRLVATGSDDGFLRLWDVCTGKRVGPPRPHTGKVYGVAFRPDGRSVAVWGMGPTVRLWPVPSPLEGEPQQVARQMEARTGLELDPNGTVRVLDVPTWRERRGLLQDLGSSEMNNRGSPGDLPPPGEPTAPISGPGLRRLAGHTGCVTGVTYSPDGKRLASTSMDKSVRVWDVANGGKPLLLRGHTQEVWGVAFRHDGRRLASVSGDSHQAQQPGELKVWDAATGQQLLTLPGHTGGAFGVAYSPDGKQLASASADRTVRLWDADTGKGLRTLEGHTDEVRGVAFSPDGKRLASASFDRTVGVWDAATGQLLQRLVGHTKVVWAVAFSPDGKRLASISDDQAVRVWDLTTGRGDLGPLRCTMWPYSVTFSPDGRHLVSAGCHRWQPGQSGEVKIWDAHIGRTPFTFRGTGHGFFSATFSPDGRHLAAAGTDNEVKLWDLPPLDDQEGEVPVPVPGGRLGQLVPKP